MTSELKEEGIEKFYKHTQILLEKKRKEVVNKCNLCWYTHDRCVCSLLKPLTFQLDVEFIVFLHISEFGNSGDASKILNCAAPSRTKFYIYGNKADELHLQQYFIEKTQNNILLFPSEEAYTVDQVLTAQRNEEIPNNLQNLTFANDIPLTIIVINGTWRLVRPMLHQFTKLTDGKIPHIRLHPESLDYWQSLGGVSAYGRTQSQPDRICTVEAIALLLKELGENQNTCEELLSYVPLNNLPWKKEIVK